MARGVKRQPTSVELLLPGDPYPQHARLHVFHRENWAIRDFFSYLREHGLVEVEFDELHDALLAFRGVDKLEYEAEVADLKSKYRWMYDQFKVNERVGRAVKPAVAKVIEAALPDKTPSDGLSFLLERIRGGKDE